MKDENIESQNFENNNGNRENEALEELYAATNEQLKNICRTLRKILERITNSLDSTEGTFNPARVIEEVFKNTNSILEQFEQAKKNNRAKGTEETKNELFSTLELLSIDLMKCFEAFPSHIQNAIKEDCQTLLSRIKKEMKNI